MASTGHGVRAKPRGKSTKPGPKPSKPAQKKPAPAPQQLLPPERPVRYSQEFADKVAAAAGVGFTITEIARLLRVSVDQVNLWVMVYPAFAAAMRANVQARTERVEAALYQRAVGYEITEQKLFYDMEAGVVRADVGRHIPAEPRAAVEWMRAHAPETWAPPSGPGAGNDGKSIVVEGGLPDPPAASTEDQGE